MHVDRRERMVDLAIGAYLVNPLKDTYLYDDVAKEYLGMVIPSKTELLGKTGFASPEEEALTTCACYLGYTAWAAVPAVMNRLAKLGMEQLFWKIEMPLVYTLYDMEQAGIQVEAQALKIYGEQLQGRIVELEQEICRQAGETFNINSPKQLGVILFEKMKLPGGKKPRPDIPPQRMCWRSWPGNIRL